MSNKPLSEKQLQRQIIQYLSTLPNVWVVKTIVTNMRGCPDLLCCINGKFVGMEVKQESGRPTPLQLAQMQMIWKAGGLAYVVKSLDEVRNIVKGIL